MAPRVGTVVLLAAALVLLVAALILLDRAFPLPLVTGPASPQRAATQGGFVVLAEDGQPLRSWASADGALRHPITPQAVSPHYLAALLTYEDQWFYWHPGINPVAMARALWQWGAQGRIVSGGSTLTMQVARILDANEAGAAPAPRSLRTKLRQMARAVQLEWHLSKRDILTLYLNHAPMGGQVQGVEMASRLYLGKPARELSQAEAALLVALPQSPSRLRPDRAPGLAQTARDKVLRRMQAQGQWPAAAVADAQLERVFAPPLKARWLAPLAAERLRQNLKQNLTQNLKQTMSTDKRKASAEPGVVRSTLDAGLQQRLEQILLDRLSGLPEAVSVAALVVENDSLAVRGYAGSADFTDNARAAHVDMVRAVRSPGSTLKPFLYALALDDGLVHAESLLIDAPQNFGGYAPGNFQASFSGPVSVSEALQRSLNVPAVDLLDRIGPARFAAHLRNAGVRLRMPAGATPNLSLILGGGGTTLEELVGAYTALARGGMAGIPRLRPEDPPLHTRLMSEGAAFIVREILENGGRPDAPFREGTARVAWKTGTSFGFRDAWAIGVTDRYTVGIWVGRPDGTPNPGFFGANTAAPLLKDTLAALDAAPAPARTTPTSVSAQTICWPLGLSVTTTDPAHCLMRRSAWTLDATTPPTLPERHQTSSLLDTAWVTAGVISGTTSALTSAATSGVTSRATSALTSGANAKVDTWPTRSQRIRPGCNAQSTQNVHAVAYARWPTLLQPWIEPAQRAPVERLPLGPPCARQSPSRSLRITGLESGTVLHAVPGRAQVTLHLQALGTTEPVNWLLDGRLVGTTQAAVQSKAQTQTQAQIKAQTKPQKALNDIAATIPPTILPTTLRLPLTDPGPHALTAMDTSGRYEQLRFEMR